MARVLFHVGRLAHPIYREQMHGAPEGYAYVADHPDLLDEAAPKRDVAAAGSARQWARRYLTRAAVATTSRAGIVRRKRVTVPTGVDLIHSGQILLRDTPIPYVVDCEDGHVFTFYQRGALERPWGRDALVSAVSDDRCRAVLPWTEAARRGLLNAIPDRPELAARVTTLPLAIRPRAVAPKRRAGGPLRLLFVGTTFFGKGGAETVTALEAVRRSHDVELDLVTFVPPHWRRRIEGNGAIRVHQGITPGAVRALYEQADAFIFPAHVDTLGWVVFEAQAAAVPVLASTHFSQPELVEDGVSGLLFPHENSLYDDRNLPRFRWFNPTAYPRRFLDALEHPSPSYVAAIAACIAGLAEDAGLCDQLSAGALERVRTGPLSVSRRRERLAAIYRAALDG